MPIENSGGYMVPVLPSDDLPDPFGRLALDLSDSELRETAYEIFVGACRSSGGGRPLTYVSQSSGRSSDRASSLPSLQRSLTLTAASKVKKALGIKSKKKDKNGSESNGSPATENRPATVGELMRVQMRISEQIDSRVRRALLRIAAGQLGRRIESIVLPVELLQQFKSSDFPTQREYQVWQRRNLRVLEAGLLLHPKLPLDKKDPSAQQLRQIIHGAYERPMETGKHSEAVQTLRNLTMQLACRSSDDYAQDTCHWADGVPLNLHIYQILLEALFDVEEPTSMIEEVDEVLDLIKKTWGILGIDQRFHNLCFSWVLFNHYVSTGQVENDFLFAADNLLLEVKKDAKSTLDSGYSKILCSTMRSMLEWAERGLLAYHESFYRGNIDLLQSILSLGLSAATILAEEDPKSGRRKGIDVANAKVDVYIRSSMRKAFSQESEKVHVSRKSAKNQVNHLPALCLLAQDVTDLAFTEKEIYSPILQRWHPLAVGVAVATLHSCFGQEVQQFVSGINELTPAVIQVLIAADKLEKDLVQMAVEDSVNSDDGGKSIIQEMTPYEAEAVIVDLVKSWIKTRVDRLQEWVDRTLQQEVWSPKANRQGFAPSAVEVLRTIDETLEAFFLLPIPMHPDLLPGLMSALDRCLQDYILKAKSGSGSRSSFLPALPPLTRCRGGSKLNVVFKKKDRSNMSQRRTSVQNTTDGKDSYSITQLCVRVNSFHYIRKDLEVLEKRTIAHLKSIGIREGSFVNGSRKNFERSLVACVEGIQQVCEATAYKLVFHELSHVLWDGLYVTGASSSRIEPFLQELEHNLEIIAQTVQDNTIRTRLITNIMRASFEGFLLVLLAGGPSRSFVLEDSSIIQEDFQFLMDLFWSNGDGLPIDLIGKHSTTVKSVLPLFSSDTSSLVEKYKSLMIDVSNGSSTKSRLALPPTTDQWGPIEPNTILRVLCHRDDKMATTFLKKNYNLPKKL